MGWGERHDTPLVGAGTTGQMSLAQDALAAVGIKRSTLAEAAIEAAGIIDKLRSERLAASQAALDHAYQQGYDAGRIEEAG